MSKSPPLPNELNLTPIGRAVAAFEAAWQSAADGRPPPRLEAALAAVPQSQRSVYLRALLAVELQFRVRLGDTPGAADYLDRFPQHVETIQALFEECSTAAFQDRLPNKRAQEAVDTNETEARPATSAVERSLNPGTILGNYTIRRLIGQGGMGAVYQAEHRLMRRNVAIKIISQSALQHPEALARFHREVQAVASLEHPNIVTAHDADQAGEINFLVMQYVEGDDLSKTVKARGPLSIDMALRVLVQAARGLEYAHRKGVIHRDIKPSNLIVARNGIVKILDMGLARLQESLTGNASSNRNLTEAGNIMGTVDFMAPEQALDAKEADQRADIYSLGCTLYYLLVGRTMYSGDTVMKRIMAHRCNPIPSLHAVRSNLPTWLESSFQKMVAKDRQDRYQSMMELLASVAPHVASGLSVPETGVSFPSHPSHADDPASQRPVAALLVRLPDTESETPKSVVDKTANFAGSTKLGSTIATGLPVPAAEPAPVHVKPTRSEPVRPEPARSGPVGHEPTRSGPVSQPAHPKPARSGPVPQPASPKPVQSGPVGPEPTRSGPTRSGPVPQPARSGSVRPVLAGSGTVVSDTTGAPEIEAPVPAGTWRMRRAAGETTARSGSTGGATIRKRRRRLLGAAAVYLCLILLVTLVAVIFLGSGDGTIVIQAADPEVAAVLTENGLRLLDVKTGREFTLRLGRHALKFGDYKVDMAEFPSWIEISTTQFRLRRGDAETLTITLARQDD